MCGLFQAPKGMLQEDAETSVSSLELFFRWALLDVTILGVTLQGYVYSHSELVLKNWEDVGWIHRYYIFRYQPV